MLLTLAEAGFFRLRWSGPILDETQAAIEEILSKKGRTDAAERAANRVTRQHGSFEDAMVTDFDNFMSAAGLPDPDDAHVIAAAIKTQTAMIVTETLKDFPAATLAVLNMEAKSADQFIADTIALDEARVIAAIRRMRERFKKSETTAEALLLSMEAAELQETVDLLRPYVESL